MLDISYYNTWKNSFAPGDNPVYLNKRREVAEAVRRVADVS
jgi:hypothetical protein